MCPKQKNRGQKRALEAFKGFELPDLEVFWALQGVIWLLTPQESCSRGPLNRGLLVWAAAAARGHSAMPGSLKTPKGFDEGARPHAHALTNV